VGLTREVTAEVHPCRALPFRPQHGPLVPNPFWQVGSNLGSASGLRVPVLMISTIVSPSVMLAAKIFMKTWHAPTLHIVPGGTDAGCLARGASVGQRDARFQARAAQRDLCDPRIDELPDNLRPQPVMESTRPTDRVDEDNLEQSNRDQLEGYLGTNKGQHTMRNMTDRRRGARFTLGLAVECRFGDGNLDQTLLGEVVNISSKGLLIRATATALWTAQTVTAWIDWPASLDNRVGLQLVVVGRVVRTTHDCTAIGIKTSEFRTRASRSCGVDR
jgi:hypothetical protein